MGISHSVPKEGGERLSDYLQREFKGKGFNADTLVVVALKEEQKQQQKDKKKRKGTGMDCVNVIIEFSYSVYVFNHIRYTICRLKYMLLRV
jgi:hypothetical protein